MNYVDVHAHLEAYRNADEIVDNAKKAGVKAIVYNGISRETNRKALEFSKRYDIVKAALGLYPIEILSMKDEDIEAELKFIEENKENIVAVGEVGLDFKEDLEQHEKQKKWFRRFIELSIKLNKPVSVHSRKAEAEVIQILEETEAKKVHMHCFSGNMKLVEKIISNGWHLSIPTNIVFSEHFQAIVKRTPMKQLLTETDSPFLSPFKGQENQPANVTESLRKIAEIKAVTMEDAANILFMNYQNLFL
jgi:TatD DNase family protein